MEVVYFYCLFLSELSVILCNINKSLFDILYNRVRREKVAITALTVFGKRRRNVNIFNGYSLMQQIYIETYMADAAAC